ncbi:Vacuolar protein sorting-associated protein 45 [Smittium mucronatum]|uniref:Vacuolar protein sorting-associated protein 45 n=1 Tax=Smittium mucronatum TaxID=133383 RepID=A0A1R0GQ10_9FUNG|nr:Vacuolar protein sorting-associated protein 45 [Smittium mucronatum]
MALISAIQSYVERMLSQVSGMKILLLDEETTSIVSVAYTQTQLLSKEVYLVDKIGNQNRERIKHLNCIIFVRPTETSITSIVQELMSPKYANYYIFFSNVIKKSVIETLAEHDELEVVKDIQEYYADYLAVLPDMFSLGMNSNNYPLFEKPDVWNPHALQRATQGLFSLFLSLKQNPSLIRYEANSNMAYQLAKELNEIVVSTENDDFFKKSMHLNFGDLGVSIKDYVNSFQETSKSNQKLDTIDDMKKFVENYPEYRKLSGNVSKHVTLVSELSRLVSDRNLLKVSELEQSLVCNGNFQTDEHMRQLQDLIKNPKIRSEEKVCLVLIFILRYEKSQNTNINYLKGLLIESNVSPESVSMIDVVLLYCGYKHRQGDLFSPDDIFSRGKSVIKRGLKGIDNVYTQHTPFYIDNMVKLIKETKNNSKIESLFPALPGTKNNRIGISKRLLVIFFVGGVTYAEQNDISKIQAQVGKELGVQIVIGGTNIINSKTFIQNLNDTFFP